MNSISIVGRAGRDPELKFFESGANIAELSVAVNTRKKEEPPTWFNVRIWGKSAQVTGDYVKKGSLVGFSGEMRTEEWVDKEGKKQSKWILNASNVWLLGSKDAQAPAPAAGGFTSDEAPF